MKCFFCLIAGCFIGYLAANSSNQTQVTYNTLGRKTVIASADTPRNAGIAVGQECEEEGYSIVATSKEEDKFVLTVVCSTKE